MKQSFIHPFIFGLICFLLTSFVPHEIFSQDKLSWQKYEEVYASYKEKSIEDRRFKHAEVVALLMELKSEDGFAVDSIGASVEGRAIYHVKWGDGPISILMWTQMHGDEPTATMAILDFFNFLTAEGARDPWLQKMKASVTLHCLPLLNPDGAERYQRHTALGIDMNRDALNLVQPESKILKSLRDQTDADWGFNLHDQSRYYSAGDTDKSARFSFLAPAYNASKDVNEKREDAMQLIALMNAQLQDIIPGHVGKFSDSFEPRAFGDNIQAWGTRTILIESGGTKEDREKQDNRKIQFMLYLLSIDAIVHDTYESYTKEQYRQIPFNNRRMFDLIIQNASLNQFDMNYNVDLGIKKHEINTDGAEDYRIKASIEELGDLRTRVAYDYFDASEYNIEKADQVLYLNDKKKYEDEEWLYRNLASGIVLYCGIRPEVQAELPILWKSSCEDHRDEPILLGSNPVLFFKKDGKRTHVLINGSIYKI